MEFKLISIIKNIFRVYSRFLLIQRKIPKDLKNSKIDKILIVSLTHLGDMVLLSPFLRNLRLNFADAQIDILLKEQVSDLLKYCPYINKRIIYNAKWVVAKNGDGFLKTSLLIHRLRKNKYNLAFVSHPHIFSNMLAWLAKVPLRIGYRDKKDNFLNISLEREEKIQHAYVYPLDLLRFAGLEIDSQQLEVYLGESEIAFARNFRRGLTLPDNSLLIGVHPGAGTRERIWFVEGYAQVIRYLLNQYNVHILLFAGEQELDITKEIKNLVGDNDKISDFSAKTDIGQLAALINECAVFLSNNSGPMHIASALGKPTVALFIDSTPGHYKIWGPLSRGSQIVKNNQVPLTRPEDISTAEVIRALDTAIRFVRDNRRDF